MTAKEYLNRAYEIKSEVNRKNRQIERLKSSAASISVNPIAEKVMSSPSENSSVAYFIDMALDLEKEVSALTKDLHIAYASIRSIIAMLDDEEIAMLLTLRYVEFYSWKRISKTMNFSESTVFRLHLKGLDMVSKKLTVADST